MTARRWRRFRDCVKFLFFFAFISALQVRRTSKIISKKVHEISSGRHKDVDNEGERNSQIDEKTENDESIIIELPKLCKHEMVCNAKWVVRCVLKIKFFNSMRHTMKMWLSRRRWYKIREKKNTAQQHRIHAYVWGPPADVAHSQDALLRCVDKKKSHTQNVNETDTVVKSSTCFLFCTILILKVDDVCCRDLHYKIATACVRSCAACHVVIAQWLTPLPTIMKRYHSSISRETRPQMCVIREMMSNSEKAEKAEEKNY